MPHQERVREDCHVRPHGLTQQEIEDIIIQLLQTRTSRIEPSIIETQFQLIVEIRIVHKKEPRRVVHQHIKYHEPDENGKGYSIIDEMSEKSPEEKAFIDAMQRLKLYYNQK